MPRGKMGSRQRQVRSVEEIEKGGANRGKGAAGSSNGRQPPAKRGTRQPQRSPMSSGGRKGGRKASASRGRARRS